MPNFDSAGWATGSVMGEDWQEVVGKNRTFVMFESIPVRNNYRSEQEGIERFDDIDHIVFITSDQTNRPCRPVTEADKRQYAQEWTAYKTTGESKIMGTSIDHWPALTKGQRLEFKAKMIHTVEQVANLAESGNEWIMDFQNLREKARKFVGGFRDAEALAQAKKEKEEANAKMDAMAAELAELKALLTAKTEPEKARK